MLSVLSWLGSFLAGPFTTLTGQFTKAWTDNKRVEAAEFSTLTAAQQASYIAALNAELQLNQIKVGNSWWGAHFMVLLFGTPAAIHWAAVFLDATFFGGGHVYNVPKEYADAEFKVALSFFVLAPTLSLGAPLFASLSQRISGK